MMLVQIAEMQPAQNANVVDLVQNTERQMQMLSMKVKEFNQSPQLTGMDMNSMVDPVDTKIFCSTPSKPPQKK